MSQSNHKTGDWFDEFAPAKINLALHVTGQMSNGYHQLQSLVVFAGVGDVVRVRAASGSQKPKDSLAFSGPFGPLLEDDSSNLLLDALNHFRKICPRHVPDALEIELEKNLPIAAGIGGGSADAGAMLRILCRMSDRPVAREAVLEMAAHLGADVPVCTLVQAAEVSGIGEHLRFLPNLPQMHLVLVNPKQPLSTAQVFRALEHKQHDALPAIPFLFNGKADFALWLKDTRNDLQPPAIELMPHIGALISLIESQPSCVLARMSGSGATVFGLFGSEREAQSAAAQIRLQAPDFWCAATKTM